MFLPFPFSHFAVSLMLSFPFCLLTATSPSHRIYSSSHGCEGEKSLSVVGTNMGKTYTIRKPCLFCFGMLSISWNYLKAFYTDSIIFFFYRYLPSFKLFHDTYISWSSNKFSMWILGCAALQWKEISRQRIKFCTNTLCSHYSSSVRERSDSFWQENRFVCFLQYCSWF